MKKIALFGSSFNPPHLGHLYVLKSAQKCFQFDKIKVIPTGNPINKNLPPGRLELVQKIFKNWSFVEIDDREIKKKGPSWTIDTLKSLMTEKPNVQFFILIGLDQWAMFEQWKNFKSLLKKAHIVIINRTGYTWPDVTPPFIKTLLNSTVFLQEQGATYEALHTLKKNLKTKNPASPLTQKPNNQKVQAFKLKKNQHSYGKDIYYLPLQAKDISSSHIRALFKKGQTVKHLVPKLALEWMKNQHITKHASTKTITLITDNKAQHSPHKTTQDKKDINPHTTEPSLPPIIRSALEILKNNQGQRIKVFDLRKKDSFPFDWTVVVSSLNSRHTKAMAEHLKRTLRKKNGLKASHVEGIEHGEWVVLDYGDVVFHLFYDYTREYYRLEELWPPCHPLPSTQ